MLQILTLSWNGKEKLIALKNSLLPALEGIEYKWGIKDNGSSDGSNLEVMYWNDPAVHLWECDHNRDSYSLGNNRLFDQMNVDSNDLVLLLNNDIVFQDTTSIKNMLQIIEQDIDVGVVGAKLNYIDDPSVIQHAGVLFHPANIGTPFHYRAGKREEGIDRKNRYYPMITGAVLLTRASIFNKIRLNERLQWSWDDSDFCMAVGASGKKIVYCGETNILHAESASLKLNPINKLFFNQNLKIFTDRWSKKIDKTLIEKYTKDPNYALYNK